MILNVAPCAKPRMSRADKWKKRQCVVNYFAFRDMVRQEISSIYFGEHMGFELDIVFLVKMPKSWSKKKRTTMSGKPHQQTPDIDNYIKGLFDALYKEDKFVWNVSAKKLWTYKEGQIIINFKETYEETK